MFVGDDWFHIFDYEVLQERVETEAEAFRTTTINVVFSCKSLLQNVLRQRDGVPSDQLSCCVDATFKLISEGWTVSTIGCNTLYRDEAGATRNKFRPFLHMLSKTERETGYEFLFRTLLRVCYPMLGLDSASSGFKVSISDHHDGLINACFSELGIGKHAAIQFVLISLISLLTILQSVQSCVGLTSRAQHS